MRLKSLNMIFKFGIAIHGHQVCYYEEFKLYFIL